MNLNLFVTTLHNPDRGSHQLVGRYSTLPKSAAELLGVLEQFNNDLAFELLSDAEVKAAEKEDTASFGDSRYAAAFHELKNMKAEKCASLSQLLDSIIASDALELSMSDSEQQQVVIKAEDLYLVFTPVLEKRLILRASKLGSYTIILGFHETTIDTRSSDYIAASEEALSDVSPKGIDFVKLPEGVLRDNRSYLRGQRWCGTASDAPKFEFYGATKKDVEKLVMIFRASRKE